MLTFKRGARKYKCDYGVTDIYKFYQTTAKEPVDKKTWKSIVEEFNTISLRSCIYEGRELNLPCRLGSIRIKKRAKSLKLREDGSVDTDHLSVNWKKTKLMWMKKYPDKTPEEIAGIPIEEKKLIYNLNEHTGKHTFKFYWDKVTNIIPNKTYYRIRIIRELRREIAKAIFNNDQLQYIYFK